MAFIKLCCVLFCSIFIQTVYTRYDFDQGPEEHELVPPVIQALAAQPMPKDPLAIDDFRLHALSVGHLIAELLRHEIRMMSRLANTGMGSLDVMKVNVTEAANSLGVGATQTIGTGPSGQAPVATTVITTYAGASPTVTLSTQAATNQEVPYNTQQAYLPPEMAPANQLQQTGNNAIPYQQAPANMPLPYTNPLNTPQAPLTPPQSYVQPATNLLPQQTTPPLPAAPSNYPAPTQPATAVVQPPIVNPLNGYQVPPAAPQAYAQPATMTPSSIIPQQITNPPVLPPPGNPASIQPTTEPLAAPTTNYLSSPASSAPQPNIQPENPQTQLPQSSGSQIPPINNDALPPTTPGENNPPLLQPNPGSMPSSNNNSPAMSAPPNVSPGGTTLSTSPELPAQTASQNVPAKQQPTSSTNQPQSLPNEKVSNLQSTPGSTQPPLVQPQNPPNPNTPNANAALLASAQTASASQTPPPAAQVGDQTTPPTANVISPPQPVATPPLAPAA